MSLLLLLSSTTTTNVARAPAVAAMALTGTAPTLAVLNPAATMDGYIVFRKA